MKKTKTQAFANLIGSLIFIAVGVWALIQTYSFQEVKNTYVQAAVFPQIMCVGMLIFAVILLIQSIIKLMTMDENDPLAEPAASINFIKDKGVLAALFVMLLCALFVVFFFDLDGKLLFNVVEPFLKKHYDNMERRDMLKAPYEIDKFPKYEY